MSHGCHISRSPTSQLLFTVLFFLGWVVGGTSNLVGIASSIQSDFSFWPYCAPRTQQCSIQQFTRVKSIPSLLEHLWLLGAGLGTWEWQGEDAAEYSCIYVWLGMMVHTCNTSTGEAEVGRSLRLRPFWSTQRVLGQPVIHAEAMPQTKQWNKIKPKQFFF